MLAWRTLPKLVPAVVLLATAAASADDYAQFRTPSGAIGCGYYDGVLRCDVAGGVVPLPPRPKSCELDWGQGFNVRQHGGATVVCAGDTALDPRAPVVRYGTTWRRGGIACSSAPNGLRCTNADRHGFFISRGEAYRF
jgi:hypothetical protein